jgi:hypothetical protein
LFDGTVNVTASVPTVTAVVAIRGIPVLLLINKKGLNIYSSFLIMPTHCYYKGRRKDQKDQIQLRLQHIRKMKELLIAEDKELPLLEVEQP